MAILIFSIVAMGLGSAVVAGKNALLVSDIPTQLRQNVLFALMPMVRELRQTAASKISLADGASSSSITFKLPYDIDADEDVVDDIGNIEWGQDIVYSVDGAGQLIRTSAGTTSVIAPNIATLQFSRLAGEDALLQIDITVAKEDGQGNLYQDAEQATVKMRN